MKMAFKSTSSRFAFLSDDASDPFEKTVKKEKTKTATTDGTGGNKTGNKSNKNKKKSSSAKDNHMSNSNSTSDKKEKSQGAQSPQSSSSSTKFAQGDHVEHPEHSQKSQSPNRPLGMNDAQWAQWKQRDLEVTEMKFESDLEAALMQSKLDFQQQQSRVQQESQSKAKTKKKPISVPLKDFNAMLNSGAPLVPLPQPEVEQPNWSASLNGYMCDFPDKELDKIREEAQMEMRREKQLELDRQLLHSRRQVPIGPPMMSLDNLDFRHILAEKDAIITKLTQEQAEKMELEKELEISKARFKKLWSVVNMANLKDKVYLSAEVEKLTTLNQHLTEEISTLHSQLEQERSKSKVLECRKLEQSRRRTESQS